MTKRYLVLLTWLAAMGVSSGAPGKKVGPEFQVNTYTRDRQFIPSVASDASGNFVVVWNSNHQDEDGSEGVFGQRYDNDGNALGGEFQVNTYTTNDQDTPAVASDPSGNFVVVWKSYGPDFGPRVFGQRYDSGGNPLGDQFRVNTYTGGVYDPDVASDASGNFVVVWTNYGQDGSLTGVFGQRYDNNGNPIGGAFQVNTYTPAYQENPSVASDASGNFVVIWHNLRGGNDVFGQRYDNDGNALGGEFQVNTYTTGLSYSDVASDASGNFVVVWGSDGQDGSLEGVFAQRYDSSGNRVGGEFQVNTYTTSTQWIPKVASDASGNFVVVWRSTDQDGSEVGVFGQRYTSDGLPLGSEFQVNTYTTASQWGPAVSSDPNGNFVVVWASRGQDGSDDGVFGQRFAAGCNASVRVQGDVSIAGTIVPVQVHIAHGRPETVTVRWKLSLLDASGQVVAKHISPPHTFKFGDVLDQVVNLPLPDALASGEYTLDLAVKQMEGTRGAKTTLRVLGRDRVRNDRGPTRETRAQEGRLGRKSWRSLE